MQAEFRTKLVFHNGEQMTAHDNYNEQIRTSGEPAVLGTERDMTRRCGCNVGTEVLNTSETRTSGYTETPDRLERQLGPGKPRFDGKSCDINQWTYVSTGREQDTHLAMAQTIWKGR